jgi:hypothetical protein
MPSASVPAAIATASAVAGIAGAGVAAYGAIQSGEAQSRAANYQAQVAANNQVIAGQNADYAKQAGAVQEASKRTAIAALIGSQRTASAANNLDVNSGSALDLQSSAAALGEEDARTIRDSAARTARGYQIQGIDYGAQAQLDRMTADQASTAGGLNAFASILGGASSVSDKYLRYKQAGG